MLFWCNVIIVLVVAVDVLVDGVVAPLPLDKFYCYLVIIVKTDNNMN